MALYVFHGTNSKILQGFRTVGSIAPLLDPLLENVRRMALDLGEESYRRTMIRRDPSVYAAAKRTTANLYSISSPEFLCTALNLIAERDPKIAGEMLRHLEAAGWFEIKPVVLKIRIEDASEVGLALSGNNFHQESLVACAGPSDELILKPLSIDRIIEVSDISGSHVLHSIKDKMETMFTQTDISLGALIDTTKKLINRMLTLPIQGSEIADFIKLIDSFTNLFKIYQIIRTERKTKDPYLSNIYRDSAVLTEIRGYVAGFENAFRRFRNSELAITIKDTPEYTQFKSVLWPIMRVIAQVFASQYYYSHSHRYMTDAFTGNMFFLASAVSIAPFNTGILTLHDSEVATSVKAIETSCRVDSARAMEILKRLMTNVFEIS